MLRVMSHSHFFVITLMKTSIVQQRGSADAGHTITLEDGADSELLSETTTSRSLRPHRQAMHKDGVGGGESFVACGAVRVRSETRVIPYSHPGSDCRLNARNQVTNEVSHGTRDRMLESIAHVRQQHDRLSLNFIDMNILKQKLKAFYLSTFLWPSRISLLPFGTHYRQPDVPISQGNKNCMQCEVSGFRGV
jgi:hypothetical protein